MIPSSRFASFAFFSANFCRSSLPLLYLHVIMSLDDVIMTNHLRIGKVCPNFEKVFGRSLWIFSIVPVSDDVIVSYSDVSAVCSLLLFSYTRSSAKAVWVSVRRVSRAVNSARALVANYVFPKKEMLDVRSEPIGQVVFCFFFDFK